MQASLLRDEMSRCRYAARTVDIFLAEVSVALRRDESIDDLWKRSSYPL